MTGTIKLTAVALWFLLLLSISAIATEVLSAGVQGTSKVPGAPTTATTKRQPTADEEEDDDDCDDDDYFGAEEITPPSST